jgi:hypothetical protein
MYACRFQASTVNAGKEEGERVLLWDVQVKDGVVIF